MPRSVRAATYLAMAAIVGAPANYGAGDAFVSDFANSHKTFYANRVVDERTKKLTESGVIAPVTDETLRKSFEAITPSAVAGEPEAALILFPVAETQRKPKDE